MPDEHKLSKYAAIFQDLTAADIMVANVAALPADKKVAHAKEMMKIKRISGLPVVDEKRRVIGIISIEDIINALEFNRMNEPLRKFMSPEVVTVRTDAPLAELVAKFENYRFGRFPVVDREGVLRGIVTKEDILHGILEKFSLIYVHDRKRNLT
ncbi:MAG TPA: CBS domain-containing protein, partial [Candidatus Aminicenantes bacterium]|nr:CBS domain-containing protein [Candidatus Aminicenantes bacterium]